MTRRLPTLPLSSGAGFMIQSALAFSIMTLLVKLVGQRLPSQEIVVARAFVSLILSFFMLRREGVSPWGHDRRWLWFRGVLGFLGLSCVYAAVTHLPLAEATVLQYLHPAITALLAGLFLGEALTGRLFAATATSLLGVVLVARPEFLFGSGAGALDPLWVGVALGGAFFSASAYVVVRRLSRTEHPLVIVFYFPLVTLPLAIPTMLPQFVMPQGAEWLILLGVGVATQIGQVSLTRGLSQLPAATGTALSYLQVVFAAAWGYLFFSERLDGWTLLGGSLVVLSAFGVAQSKAARGKGV